MDFCLWNEFSEFGLHFTRLPGGYTRICSHVIDLSSTLYCEQGAMPVAAVACKITIILAVTEHPTITCIVVFKVFFTQHVGDFVVEIIGPAAG